MTCKRRSLRHWLTALASAGLLTGNMCVGTMGPPGAADPDECFDTPRGVFSQLFCDGRVVVTVEVVHEEFTEYRGNMTVGLVVASASQQGGPLPDCTAPDWEAMIFDGNVVGMGEARGRMRIFFADPSDPEAGGGLDLFSVREVENVTLLLHPQSPEFACSDRNALDIESLRYRNPFLPEEGVRDMTYMLRRVSE